MPHVFCLAMECMPFIKMKNAQRLSGRWCFLFNSISSCHYLLCANHSMGTGGWGTKMREKLCPCLEHTVPIDSEKEGDAHK